jgi:hypothetical protein
LTYNRSWKSTPSSSSSTSVRHQLILAVGRRVFVHLPETGPEQGDFRPFGRKPGATPDKEIRDGQEVEIIAWRPMAPEGLSYQIVRLSDQREWWARATCLRTSASAGLAA